MTVRTRFAPSPTGYLHIGGVRTALFNYILAKQAGGQFILRIDDTDAQRNVEAALQPILDGFRWLGLNWDEGPDVGGPHAPYYQSQRSSLYQDAVARLLASGHAYWDYSRPEELQAMREEADRNKKTFLYDRRYEAKNDADAVQFRSEGRPAVVRLKMPREGKCEFQDLIRGDVQFDWGGEADHVIQRGDGTCIYHLASVVDDNAMQITHVVRAVEHLPNTPRQIFIAQSLGYELPKYAHLPYVAEPGGSTKLSKRKLDQYLKQKDFAALYSHGATITERMRVETTKEGFNPVVTDFYETIGFLPQSLINYLLLLGWSYDDSREDFTIDDAVALFSLAKVNKSPASFDPQKLIAFQTRWMNHLDLKKKVAMVMPYLRKAGWIAESDACQWGSKLSSIVAAAGDRIKVAGDILLFDELFLDDDSFVYDETVLKKRLGDDPQACELIREFKVLLEAEDKFEASKLESLLTAFLEEKQKKFGQIAAGLRVAITGKATGLHLFDYFEILGKDSSLRRIERSLQKIA